MAGPPRQYLLGPERQLDLEGRAEPLHVRAVVPPPEEPPSRSTGDRRQLPLQLPGPDGRSRQLAMALFPEERRNPAAGVVLDDLEAVVQDWPAFWAPLDAELEEVQRAGKYKYLESVRLLALGRWIHGIRHEAIERGAEVTPGPAGRDNGCPLQIPARGLAAVLCCRGSTRAAKVTRAFRVLRELVDRGEILRHPRLVTLRWATRHRAPGKQLLEIDDLDAEGKEVIRRRIDVHGVVYFRWSGIRFIERRGDRYRYVVRARARDESTVKLIAGPNFEVLSRFNRQLRRVASRLRGAQVCIPTATSLPERSFLSSSRTGGGAAARRPPRGENGGAPATVAAPSPRAPEPPATVDYVEPRAPKAQDPISENKGPPPLGRRASGAGVPARATSPPTREDRELEAEKAALRVGWALPELRAEVERCWHHVELVPHPDAKGRPVYLGTGELRVRPAARPITTVERWRPGAWAAASPEARERLRRLFGPVQALITQKIRWGEQPPAPTWRPPPARKRGRFDTGLHAFGRGRCKQCGRQAPLMYEADVRGRMLSLGYCERCWNTPRSPTLPASATPAPEPVLRPGEASVALADVLRRSLGLDGDQARAFADKFKPDKKR